jgi:UDP-2,3-diacylglucosamine hydrolase
MNLFVLSDLHISGPEDPLYHSLLKLLRERTCAGDTLVFAGDLFDLFVGNKEIFKKRYSAFLEAAGEAGKRGVSIHYIEGNHDFLIHQAFNSIRGLVTYPDHVSVTLAGKRFYFTHGDQVDRQDVSYRILRAFFRSPVMRALVRCLPGKWLDRIGQTSSRQSRKRKPRFAKELPLERMEYLRRVYRSYAAERLAEGFDFVVMGHSHDLDEMNFNIGGRPGQYVNMGFPRVHGSFLSWSPGEEKIRRERLF